MTMLAPPLAQAGKIDRDELAQKLAQPRRQSSILAERCTPHPSFSSRGHDDVDDREMVRTCLRAVATGI